MKKLLAVLLAIALIATLGITTAFAEEEPIHLTLWTFQELHTQLYKEMLDPRQPQAGDRHAGLSL